MTADTIPHGILRMNGSSRTRNRLLISCCISLAAHGVFLHIAALGPLHFGKPVTADSILTIDLQKAIFDTSERDAAISIPAALPDTETSAATASIEAKATADAPIRAEEAGPSAIPAAPPILADDGQAKTLQRGAAQVVDSSSTVRYAKLALPSPIRSPAEFIGSTHEKLAYAIDMFGIPVGEASLEARNVDGELRIVSEIKSNSAISAIYPVDTTTETRMFNGRYIMTTIKRREAGSQVDVGFTLCLSERKVFWADRLNNRYLSQPLPDERVLDLITGFYYLRNQPLNVGSTVVLGIFDSNAYAPTPVHVLRREHINLPGFREADTVVVWPELQTEGPFKRTGELLVWLTDDEYRVPVRFQTSIALGKVTAELVSAETE